MSALVRDLTSIIEELIPPALAEPWDNVGLQIGDPAWPVRRVQVALDATAEVVKHACSQQVDLLLTHHPLIFKPLKKIDLETPQGKLLEAAISNRMAIYAAHTNFDRLAGGLNDILAHRIGLQQIRHLDHEAGTGDATTQAAHGMGRIGKLKRITPLEQLAQRLKSELGLDHLRMSGRAELAVETVALCTGSGSGLLDQFLGSDAQVYISGDLRYHDARAVQEAGLGLIDIGHFPSEHLMVEALAGRLAAVLRDKGVDAEVTACRIEKDPFVLV